MNKIRSILIVAIALVLVFGAVAQAEKKEFKMGVLQWNDLILPSTITKHVMESRFGYKIREVEFFEWGIAYAALAKGDVDVMIAQVDYVSHDYWKRSKNKLEKLSPVCYGLYQGLVVPTYVPLESIEELNANKDKFDNKIVGIEPGSGLMRQTHSVVKEYGLELTLVDGSTAAMCAALKSALDRKKWIVVTLWDPSWPMVKWDLKFLRDPKGIQEPHQTYFWIGRKGFSQEYPFARELMAGVFVAIEEIAKMDGWIAQGLEPKKAGMRWVEENKERINRWCVIGGEDRYK